MISQSDSFNRMVFLLESAEGMGGDDKITCLHLKSVYILTKPRTAPLVHLFLVPNSSTAHPVDYCALGNVQAHVRHIRQASTTTLRTDHDSPSTFPIVNKKVFRIAPPTRRHYGYQGAKLSGTLRDSLWRMTSLYHEDGSVDESNSKGDDGPPTYKGILFQYPTTCLISSEQVHVYFTDKRIPIPSEHMYAISSEQADTYFKPAHPCLFQARKSMYTWGDRVQSIPSGQVHMYFKRAHPCLFEPRKSVSI